MYETLVRSCKGDCIETVMVLKHLLRLDHLKKKSREDYPDNLYPRGIMYYRDCVSLKNVYIFFAFEIKQKIIHAIYCLYRDATYIYSTIRPTDL